MNLLLDTCAVIWWFDDDPRLGEAARDLLVEGGTNVVVSVAALFDVPAS